MSFIGSLKQIADKDYGDNERKAVFATKADVGTTKVLTEACRDVLSVSVCTTERCAIKHAYCMDVVTFFGSTSQCVLH